MSASCADGQPEERDRWAERTWRWRLGLPEESEDFSARDAFDVLLFLAERDEPGLPHFLVVALQRGGTDGLARELAQQFRNREKEKVWQARRWRPAPSGKRRRERRRATV